jgi:ADP-heptose:LPS heptosyltransferase
MTNFAACLNLIRRVTRKAARTPAWAARSIATLYRRAIHQLVLVLTEQYWLIDYLPKKSTGNESVLLVRLDLIGDFVIWLDAAKEFRNLYPNKRLVLYANSTWAALAEKLSYWDLVIAVDVPRLREDHLYRLGVLTQTHWRGFGIAIQPTYSREYVGDLVIRATRAAHRIAHLGDTNNITLDHKVTADAWYTRLIPKAPGPEVELTINAALIRALGNASFESNVPMLPVLAVLPALLKINAPYCVIVPGASWAPKTWPIESFAQLAHKIQAQHRLQIVLCGTLNEQSICRQLALICGGDILDLAGKTTLIQLVELIRHATLVVANDSAAVHIAAATDTKAVCVLGGGHYGRFLPYQLEVSSTHQRLPTVLNEYMDCYGCLWRCKYLDASIQLVPCVANVSLERVGSACADILNLSES